MKKSDFTGWREVFEFTFSQTVKQKAYGIFLVVFSVIALLYSTAITVFTQYSENKESKTVVGEVVIFDETGLDVKYEDVFTSKKFKNISVISNPTETFEEYEKQMEETADNTMLVKVTIDVEEEKYHVLFIQGKDVGLSELSRMEFADEFCDYFKEARMDAINISKEQQEKVQSKIVREVKTLSETGEIIDKPKDGISYNDYFITLMMLIVCMMLVNISGNQIALSIVTEKSSRVLEYLVINVRPLALIVGKLLATIVTAALQMITVGFCFLASPIISNMITPRLLEWFFGISRESEVSTQIAEEALANSIQTIHGIKMEFVLFAIIFMVLGIIFYGIIAGLLGASASKMDELQEVMTLFQLIMIIGCYGDIALCVMQITGNSSPILNQILSICPITSPFIVPCNMILGKMSGVLILVSTVVMLLVIVILFLLTANVYEAMIFYNGKALKVKDIIALASSKKKIAIKEEATDEK